LKHYLLNVTFIKKPREEIIESPLTPLYKEGNLFPPLKRGIKGDLAALKFTATPYPVWYKITIRIITKGGL